jgi:hypothetical protein
LPGIQHYTWADTQATTATWYRLRLIDKDGSYSYSGVLFLGSKGTEKIAVYPNPFHEAFFLQYQSMVAEKLVLRVADLQGRIVLPDREIAVTPGRQTIRIAGFDGLPAGMYHCILVSASGIHALPVNKQ